jgi:hypothetical protein
MRASDSDGMSTKINNCLQKKQQGKQLTSDGPLHTSEGIINDIKLLAKDNHSTIQLTSICAEM